MVLNMWRKYLPPVTKCDLCGGLLFGKARYRVYLMLRKGPLKGARFKKLHVCEECLKKLKENSELKKRFKLKYRKMKILR